MRNYGGGVLLAYPAVKASPLGHILKGHRDGSPALTVTALPRSTVFLASPPMPYLRRWSASRSCPSPTLWASRCALSTSRPPHAACHSGPMNADGCVEGRESAAFRACRSSLWSKEDTSNHHDAAAADKSEARGQSTPLSDTREINIMGDARRLAEQASSPPTPTSTVLHPLSQVRAGVSQLVTLIETPSIVLFSVVKHTLRMSVLLAISTLELGGEVYRSAVHPYWIRLLRFAVGTPLLGGLIFLLVMRQWYFPEPRLELDTSSVVAGLRHGGQSRAARPAEPLIAKHTALPPVFAEDGLGRTDRDGTTTGLSGEDGESGLAEAPTETSTSCSLSSRVIVEDEFEEELEPRLCVTADELMRYTQALRQGYRALLLKDQQRRRHQSETGTSAHPAAEASKSDQTEGSDLEPAEVPTPAPSSLPHSLAVPAALDPANALSPQQRNDLLHDVLWAIRSLEENIMNTQEERAFVTPRHDLLQAPPPMWPGHSGVAAAATRETSPAEFTLRVLLSISIEQGWFDLVEHTRSLFVELVHNRPLPLQTNVARAVGDLCVLSYEMDVSPPFFRPTLFSDSSEVSSLESFLSGSTPYSLRDGIRRDDALDTSPSSLPPTLCSSSPSSLFSWRRWWATLLLSRDAHARELAEVENDDASLRCHSKMTMQQKRRVARAIDTFRPERAVEERPTIASEITLMPLRDAEQTTRCVGLIRRSVGRRPQLVLVFVGSNTTSNWLTNLDFSTIPLPVSFGVQGPPPASSSATASLFLSRFVASVLAVKRWWLWSSPSSPPLSAASSSTPLSTGTALVHRGFYDLVSTIPYKEMAKDFDHIIVVGHSLGGALAQLAGLELAAERPSRRITVMTMASPRVLAVDPEAYKAFMHNLTSQDDTTLHESNTVRAISDAARNRAHKNHDESKAYVVAREDPIAAALSLPPNYRHIRGYLRPDAVPQLPPERLCYTHTGRPLPLQTGCTSFSSFIATGMVSKLFHSADLYWQLLNQKELAVAHTHTYNHELDKDVEETAAAESKRVTASLIRQHVRNI